MQPNHLSKPCFENVPSLHNHQIVVLFNSQTFENEPSGQLIQISSYKQFGHSFDPSNENCPSGQSWHSFY